MRNINITKPTILVGILCLSSQVYGATELRFASSQPETGGYMGEYVKVLGDSIEERTNSDVTVKGYYSGALGSNERELAEMTKSGGVDIANTATTYIQGWMPSSKIFDFPYMFSDVEHYKKVIQGDIGDRLKDEARDDGVEVLSFVIAGFRSIFNNERPVHSVEDLEGLTIRSMESPIYVDMFERLGMRPTPMPSSELYSALQLGTVDAGENDPASVMAWGWNEVIDYYTLDRHSIAVMAIIMNKDRFDSFDGQTQDAILEAGREAENYQIDYIQEAWSDSLEQIVDSGVEVVELDEDAMREFREAVRPTIDEFESEVGADLIESVRSLE
ncbi:TRAP transporter substrate-binding protein [Billgrantia lactosivorans]|uniref:TRAP transporter substrate-binding protein n=1 Tax=Billgrantia lactosivorans TaxID=2185141 RepID=UPI0013A6E653|nr:TRAP transporter substrate-binding protein [Halomonas lactosivorans]